MDNAFSNEYDDDDVEISEIEKHSSQNLRRPQGFEHIESARQSTHHEMSFKEEFFHEVAVHTILSGQTVIGRSEARLMLCQYRHKPMHEVSLVDPAVLMLDGMTIESLESFLDSAGESIIETIRGDTDSSDDDDDNEQDAANQQSQQSAAGGDAEAGAEADEPLEKITIKEVAEIFQNFKNCGNPPERTHYREEFLKGYQRLDAVQRLQIPSHARSVIESALALGPSNQETLLNEVELPEELLEDAPKGESGMMTDTARLYGEYSGVEPRQRKRSLAHEAAALEGKNLKEWLRNNKGSQHVWFFFAGAFMAIIYALQVWVDYAFGKLWRAILMELLSATGVLICFIEADTEFIRARIQSRIFVYYQFLTTVGGRTIFYLFISFLSFGDFQLDDLMAVLGGLALLTLTLIRFWLYVETESRFISFVFPMVDSSYARDKFRALDKDRGYLVLEDMEYIVGNTFLFKRWFHEVAFWRMDAATNDGRVDINDFVQFLRKIKHDNEMKINMKQQRKQQQPEVR